MSLVIPDELLQAAQITENELKLEIAIILYQQRKISIGKAHHFAQMHLIDFQKELNKRGICLNYDMEDLQTEIKTLQKLGDL